MAQRVDGYFARFRGRRKWVYRLTLAVFLPLSLLPRGWRRRILKRWFYGGLRKRRIPRPLRGLASVGIRMAKQLCYAGYYGDPRTWEAIGYEPFSKRATPPDHRPVRLDVTPSSAVTEATLHGDIVIVGSGAAGSILAHELIAHTGRSVLLLERGAYVPQDEFTEDEAEMLGKLYADGALQLSADFQFQVLQGSCVGGTTVVNNAVSFRLPDGVLRRWNRDFDAGIDPDRLVQCFEHVERLIGVRRQQRRLQISHYARSATPAGYLLETWFNPPVAQSLTMPGWFEDHFRNMARYGRMTSVGVLVGTESSGRVRPGGLTGQVIDYTPSETDLGRVVEGPSLRRGEPVRRRLRSGPPAHARVQGAPFTEGARLARAVR